MSEGCSDDSDEDFDYDFYYENFENYSVVVDHLEFNGYVLPALHKIGDLLENKATVTARIVLTGKATPKATKSKTKSKSTKKEIKEKKPKVKKEPKEKKPRESKSRKRSESGESLEAPKKKVKTSDKKKQQDLLSDDTEGMEEEKLDILDDESEIEEMRVKPKVESPAKKKPSVTKKPEQDNKNQKKESVTKQKPKPAKEQITIHDSSDEEPSKAAVLKGLDDKIFGAVGANSSIEEEEIKPRSRSKPSVTKKPAEQKPVAKKAEPAKLQPSKTTILEGLNEKLFGESSEEEAPVNKPKPAVTKKPAATTTTQDTKMQVEETKKEEKPAPTKSKIRMDSADSIEYPKKKTNVPETKKQAETKDNGAKEKLFGEESEEEKKPVAKPKVQTEPPVPPAAAKEKSQTMNPPQDKKQQKKNAATQDLKKKDIVNFVNHLSDDSEEVPSPLVTKKDKNGVVTKPKVDPIVVPTVVQQEEAKVTVKTVEKKEVIELISPSTENNVVDISMTKSVFTVGPPPGAKIGEVTAFRKLSTQELTKPIVQEESPVDFKIHELIESEEEQKAVPAKTTAKKGNAKKAQGNENEKGGKQGGPLQKKTQNIILENPVASEKEPKKLDLNGKGKGKQAAKSGGKKKKRSLSSSSSESEPEPDTKKQQRNVNLFQ